MAVIKGVAVDEGLNLQVHDCYATIISDQSFSFRLATILQPIIIDESTTDVVGDSTAVVVYIRVDSIAIYP
jgi:hypothetical protein